MWAFHQISDAFTMKQDIFYKNVSCNEGENDGN